jgi:hypothetical protein
MPTPDLVRPKRVDAKLSLTNFNGGTALVTIFTVPANQTYRIRTAIFSNATASITAAVVNLLIGRGGANVQTSRTTLAQNATTFLVQANDAIYLEAGDSLVASTGLNVTGIFLSVVYEVIQ